MTRFVTRLIGVSILLSVAVNNPALISGFAQQAKNTLTGTFATVQPAQPDAADAAPVRSASREVRFTENEGGRPVVWDTCEIVPVVVNTGSTGEQGMAVVKRAVAKLRELTGVRFVVTGTTDAVPTTDW